MFINRNVQDHKQKDGVYKHESLRTLILLFSKFGSNNCLWRHQNGRSNSGDRSPRAIGNITRSATHIKYACTNTEKLTFVVPDWTCLFIYLFIEIVHMFVHFLIFLGIYQISNFWKKNNFDRVYRAFHDFVYIIFISMTPPKTFIGNLHDGAD